MLEEVFCSNQYLEALLTMVEIDHNIWLPVVVYTAFRFMNSSSCIGWLQKWLWMPVEYYSYDALSTASHAHIMTLSSDFHDNKSSSDLIQAVSGGRSVADLLETVCFQVVPMFIDLAVAFGYLWSRFGPYMGLMMVTTASTYLYVTTKLVSMRAGKRRKYIAVMRKEWQVGYDSLDGWATASVSFPSRPTPVGFATNTSLDVQHAPLRKGEVFIR